MHVSRVDEHEGALRRGFRPAPDGEFQCASHNECKADSTTEVRFELWCRARVNSACDRSSVDQIETRLSRILAMSSQSVRTGNPRNRRVPVSLTLVGSVREHDG
jgi:hypothetical protein